MPLHCSFCPFLLPPQKTEINSYFVDRDRQAKIALSIKINESHN